MAKQVQDFYKATITQDWSIGTGNFYVSVKPTISEGWLYISPNNSAIREKIYYNGTGTDSNGDYITITERGVGTTDEQTHTIGEPVRMNVGEDFIKYMTDSIDAIVAAGTPNADTSTAGKVEIAIPTEIDAGTATGSTGASIVITPDNLKNAHNIPSVAPGTSGNVMSSDGTDWISTSDNNKKYTVGALDNTLVKTYFNIQLPFILWTGAVLNDTTTTFYNWNRSSSTEVALNMLSADFRNIGISYLYLGQLNELFFRGASDTLDFSDTEKIVLDWWAKLPATGTGDIRMGFATSSNFVSVYNSTSLNSVVFTQRGSTGLIYATTSKTSVGVTNTEVTGVTATNWNNYRIELDLGVDAKFYVNGVLKETITTNLPVVNTPIHIGFGRSGTTLFQVTAPTLSIEMNP